MVLWLRRHPEMPGTRIADGMALGLVPGLAIGRLGCYSVGEHLGGNTDFFLAVHYLGGDTREGPIAVGAHIHNTALYEFLLLWPLFGLMLWLRKRGAPGGVLVGTFTLWYGVQRFLTDFLKGLRQDERGPHRRSMGVPGHDPGRSVAPPTSPPPNSSDNLTQFFGRSTHHSTNECS